LVNPFKQNVGMARQLKVLGVDADDATFKTEDPAESLQRLDESLEEKRDRSKAFRIMFKADEEEQKQLAKRKIIQKKIYPKVPQPNLLTWIEKELIRYLHEKDPVEWSHERLSECFPATTGVIHKVLKSGTMTDRKLIETYNKEVVKNWKLLSKGKLELEPAYENHLKMNYKTLQLPLGEKNLAEQEIMIRFEKKTTLGKPLLTGEFASIIKNYHDKLEAEARQRDIDIDIHKTKNVDIEVPTIFGENSIPGTPLPNEVSPYTDTALLLTKLDLKSEQPMTMDHFRKTFLKNKSKENPSSDEDPNPLRVKYLNWIHKEEKKSKYAAKSVTKLNTSEVLKSIEEKTVPPVFNNEELETGEMRLSETGEVYYFDPESGYKIPNMMPGNPNNISIPEELRFKFKVFQHEDSFYDRDGNFLYRVPGIC